MNKQFSYVDLPAIFAGTAVALAISIVLFHFGSVIGLAVTPDTTWTQETVTGQTIAIGLWTLWVQILSSLIGGYIAGRMRAPVEGATVHERDMRDGIHGAAVWAFGTVLVTIAAGFVTAVAAIDPDVAVTPAAEIIQLNEKVAIIAAFSTASVSLISGLAAWWAATKGGDHRDEGTDLTRYVSFRKKV